MVPAMAPAIVLGQSTTQTDLVPASHIRLHSSTPSNIVAPGSPIELSAHVESLIEQASRRLVFRASMLRASDGEIVATSREMVAVDSDGNGGPHTFELTTPEQEGVYEIRIDLTIDDETIWDRFRKPKPALDQLGRPVFVIRDELTAPATDAPVRPVLAHLPDLKWIETLIESKPYNPSSDPEFQASCDPKTIQAQRLWSATRRLAKFIKSNELNGVLLTTNSNGIAWPNTTNVLSPFAGAGLFEQNGFDKTVLDKVFITK